MCAWLWAPMFKHRHHVGECIRKRYKAVPHWTKNSSTMLLCYLDSSFVRSKLEACGLTVRILATHKATYQLKAEQRSYFPTTWLEFFVFIFRQSPPHVQSTWLHTQPFGTGWKWLSARYKHNYAKYRKTSTRNSERVLLDTGATNLRTSL